MNAKTNTAVAEITQTAAVDGNLTITPVAKEVKAPKEPSKAEISRGIMTSLHAEGKSYEEIIAEMQRVNGYDRQLARGTYKANYLKAGVPAPVEGVKPGKKAKAETTEAAPAATGDAPAADAGTPASEEAPV